MKKNAGFTLIEILVATAVSMLALGAAMLMFRDSTKVNNNVTQGADMNDNMRAGLNLIVQDLIQAGTGIPTGGISIPNTPNAAGCNTGAPVTRPPAALGLTFQGPNALNVGCNVILPAVEPGDGIGPVIVSPDGVKGPATDIITVLYADNTLALDQTPINGAACPGGAIAADGSSITFAAACATIGAAGIPVNPGDLIMIYNANGPNGALQTVTNVNGQTLDFAAGDAFNLNGHTTTAAAGTIKQLQNLTGGVPNGTYPATTATRIWMITYYLSAAADPAHPMLMREVNFKNPEPVAESFENLQFSYNFDDGTAPPPVNQGAVPTVPAPTGDNENQIRSVNVYIEARTAGRAGQFSYIRSNLSTQVALRSLAYFNTYK
jgi:prepilin-type N-terminal cleavage/methylation domain-containing protein